MISECKDIGVESTDLFSIVIFSFFGASLSVKDAFLLGTSGWSLVIFLTLILIFARFITVKFFMRIFSLEKTKPFVMLNIITGGPLTLIVLRKFIPGFNSGLTSEDLSLAFTICTTSMLITVIITIENRSVLSTPILIIIIQNNKISKALFCLHINSNCFIFSAN